MGRARSLAEKEKTMITLISRWELLDGCPTHLKDELDSLANKVKAMEPDTLMYLVHLQAPGPLDASNNPVEPPPPLIPLAGQNEVIFLEIYKDDVAFSRHVNGPVFQAFLKGYSQYFKPDPERPGWPVTNNTVLSRVSGFIRTTAD
jgi:quinol monooxygenase YgiN